MNPCSKCGAAVESSQGNTAGMCKQCADEQRRVNLAIAQSKEPPKGKRHV